MSSSKRMAAFSFIPILKISIFFLHQTCLHSSKMLLAYYPLGDNWYSMAREPLAFFFKDNFFLEQF